MGASALRLSACFTFVFTFLSSLALASPGSDWLGEQQQPDGGVYAATDLATPVQSSLEALVTRQFLGEPGTIDTAEVAGYLAAAPATDTEHLATKVLAGILSEGEYTIASLLLERQNADGGFGSAPAYQSTPYDTFWALQALEITGQLGANERFYAVQFLLNTQGANGAWNYGVTDSVFLSARLQQLLVGYQAQYGNVAEAVERAGLYISNADALIAPLSRDYFGACTALSSLSAANNTQDLQDLSDAILDGQGSDGSWEQDVFSTAICLRALVQYEAGQQGTQLASVSGQVVESGSNRPIAGATVTRSGSADPGATTDQEGRFVLSGLSAAAINLEFSASGYLSTIRGLSLNAGANNLGTVPMAKSDVASLVRGTVVNATTAEPISGASISLSGVGSYAATTDSYGSFSIAGVADGAYTLSVSRSGYHGGSSSLTVVAGNSYDLRLQLADTSTVLDDTPAPISGRIVDGGTGLPIAGTVALDGGTALLVAADGLFLMEDVSRGDHQLLISAEGYIPANYSINFPAGADGTIGDLAIYPAAENNAATDINLTVTVVDAVSSTRISGATVASGTVSALSDASGVATLSGLTALSFSVQASAEGYHAQGGNVTLNGYGDFALTFALTPETEEQESLSLEGIVTDLSGNPVEGALLDIDDAGLGVTTDATGAYSITGIDALEFSLSVNKSGFKPETRSISVAQYGRYILDVSLEPVSNEGWQVYYVSAESPLVGADQEALFTTSIQNLGTEERTVIIRGQVFDAEGTWAGELVPYTDQPPLSDPVQNFRPGEVKVLTLPFYTGQLPAGEYLVNIGVVEEGSISRDLPNGVVYTSNYTHFSIEPSDGLAGDLDFLPPLSQAGAATPVSMRVLVQNTGNTVLPTGDYQLTLSTESGEELLTRTATGEDIQPAGVQLLDFGEWIPDTAGHLSVQVTSLAVPDAGEVMDIYYVGDLASAEFRLDEYVLPEGDSQTAGHLDIRGVDTTQGTSTDPLFERAIEAVRVGGQFVGDQAIAWHRRNRCLGCHIQTQSLVGMASAAPYTDINEDQTRFLFNTLASSQQNDGRMRISHEGYRLTQQQLATWSLAEWPDKAQAHRTKLKGLQYLWSRRTTSGSSIYINHDHNTGWISTCCEGGTGIATRAISEFIQADRELADQSIPDFQPAPDRALTATRSRPRGTHLDGNLLLIAKQGMIEQYDLGSNASEVLYLDGANRQFYDVTLDSDGTLYATTDSHVVKIRDGAVVAEVKLENNGLRDIVVWNDALYAVDYNNHRIWRVTRDLDGVVFTSGGPLNQPLGLSVSHDGSRLIVANMSAYNLIAYDAQGGYEVFADGFAFRPLQIDRAADGASYYVGTQYHSNSGATSVAALQLVEADGTVMTMYGRRYAGSAVYGVAGTPTGAVYVDYGQNVLGEAIIGELDRSFVTTLENALPNLANYFLNSHTSNTSEIVRIAFRLMGLAEIRKVTEDPVLLAQIEPALETLETLLRNRQRSDGGWGRLSNYGSDPLTTAWVGYALDYMNPSAEDPMVRNAITYLLNTQFGNGSWSGQYFSTRLGSTSMVMAYMPRALERLGGLDVSVELTTATDIDYSAMNIAPVLSETQADGSVRYRWDLLGVTSSGRLIEMDLDIFDLLLGEQRPVAQAAHLEFANSFTEETIIRDIPIPSVSAVSGIGVTTGTDKPEYIANENVDIDSLVSNSGLDFNDGGLRLTIRSASGVFVESVTSGDPVDILAGGQSSHANNWNTALYPAGPYQVYAEVLDDGGEVQADAVAFFTILPSDGQHEVSGPDSYGTGIATDKAIYAQYNTVQLDSQVVNEVLNQTQAPVLAAIRVRDPSGGTFFSRNVVIQEMAPGAVNNYFDLLPLGEATPGLYTASITLWDATVSEQLAMSETLFSVIERPLAHLRGTVTVDDPLVYRGQDVTCFEEVQNRSSLVTVDAQIRYQLVNVDAQETIALDSENIQFTPNHQMATSHLYDTLQLEPGNYACVLIAQVGDDEATLDFAGFTVELPPVEYGAGVGSRGRLLILLDEPDSSGINGTSDIAELGAQDSYLRALLDANGFSYTIVYTGEDFATEFHTGLYHSYALMSEKVQLAVEVEHQLAEAVNAGAGMYIAGAFNRRNNHIERALGIYSTGRDQQADGVSIPAGALGADWPETQVLPNTMLDFERCGALALGVYVNPKQGTEPDDPQCYNLSDTDAAVAGYQYGWGKAVYVGFDTLDEATLAGGTNAYSDLMLYGLQFIQPVTYATREGSVIPLAFNLASLEVPVLVEMLIDLPDNVLVIDTVPGMSLVDAEEGVWRWQTFLEADSSADALLYVKLLDAQDINVDATIRVEIDGEWIDVGFTNLLLPAEPPRSFLDEGIQALEALVMNYPETNDFASALTAAQSALSNYTGGDSAAAVSDIQSAVGLLADSEQFEAQDARYLLDIAMLNILAGVAP